MCWLANWIDWQLDLSKWWGRARLSIINIMKQSVEVVCTGAWRAVRVAVPLWHQTEWEKRFQVFSCHTACQYVFTSALLLPNHCKFNRNACRKEKKVQRQSLICNGGHWKPPLTSLNWCKDCLILKKITLKISKSHDSERSKSKCYIAVIFSIS